LIRVRIHARVNPSTKDWIESQSEDRGLGTGEFLDLVATWPMPTQEGEKVERPEEGKRVLVAEEIELPNGLLKITRDEEGLPVAFVRAKAGAAWLPINWKRLEELNVEVQGLKADKLKKEVEKLTLVNKKQGIVNSRLLAGLPPAARTEFEMQKDQAQTPAGWPKWCMNCRVSVETPEELESHRAAGHSVRDLEPGELWKGGRRW
jgi:hypothetical protein